MQLQKWALDCATWRCLKYLTQKQQWDFGCMATLQGARQSFAVLCSPNSSLITLCFPSTKDPSLTTVEIGCLFTDLKQHRQQLDASKILLGCWLGASTLKEGCPHHLARQPAFLFGSPPVIGAKPAPLVKPRISPNAVPADHTPHIQQPLQTQLIVSEMYSSLGSSSIFSRENLFPEIQVYGNKEEGMWTL